jgi:hypothetical protein
MCMTIETHYIYFEDAVLQTFPNALLLLYGVSRWDENPPKVLISANFH